MTNNSSERLSISQFEQELLQYSAERRGGRCDKCHQPVDPNNNLAVFNYVKFRGDPMQTVWAVNRHLLPVIGEAGVVLCEGSPSNSQHLVGGMMEERPEFKNDDPEKTAAMQAIYDYMQEVLKRGQIIIESQKKLDGDQ